MSGEFKNGGSDLSTPHQSEELIDLIESVEKLSNHTTIDALPGVLLELYPAVYLDGDEINRPFFMQALDEPPARSTRIFSSRNHADIVDEVFEIRVDFEHFLDDSRLFPSLKYQQVAEVDIKQRILFTDLPGITLETILSYEFWRDETGPSMIHRKVPRAWIIPTEVEYNTQSRFINERYLDRELTAIEEDKESPFDQQILAEMDLVVDPHQVSILDEIFEPTSGQYEAQVAEFETQDEEYLRVQTQLLIDRLDGKGVVSATEAGALKQLLEQLALAA